MEWDKNTIKAFREKLSLNKAQFAKLVGAPRNLISYWESGKRNPSGPSRKLLTVLAEKEDIKKDIEKIKEKKKKEKKEDRISKEKIQAFREKLGVNQTQFAERLSLSLSAINRWESGETSPDPESQRRLKSLAKQKGIDLEELVRKAKKKERRNQNA